jgi:hypothetical protein
MTHSPARPLSAAALAALVLFAIVGQSCGPTLTYSCPSSGTHCYGQVNITETHFNVAITLVRLTLDTPLITGGDGHISDEVWLGEFPSSFCSGGNCWIEAGICAGEGTNGGNCDLLSAMVAHFFWAEAPPNGMYVFYDLAVVAAEQFGQPIIVTLAKLPLPTQPDSFVAYVGPYGGVSQNNTMSANYINFGLELAGTMGASASDAHFTNIYYMDTSQGGYLTGGNAASWNSQGTFLDNPPVDANWEIYPFDSSTGGKFHTSLK